ncbi:carboxypeptidase family protein [Neolewinella xylanilytica]|uniref:Carboxypeptidase family protein n=1 Tax=Neolewinella xylanilytica TaxID=1514080 RepID=A0A2S6I4J7_9BACT|nr:M14 family zinc carboxypeptidase [Neolewinella xylanilytica]PPK86106.1 carboxypeptidase family protein [Neolewinella xylanilytica]
MKWLTPVLLLLFLGSFSPVQAQDELRVSTYLDRKAATLVPEAAYPSYDLYEDIMFELARRYPDRCRIEIWGTLASGRRILVLKLADNLSRSRNRPQVLCTATMHGDELAGYWMLLRLAESLLQEDPRGLLSEVALFINPLANPDGAFRAGNRSLAGAQRGNADGVDLNRNYPDPDDGRYPDGNDHQPETRIFMRAAETHGFDLAINFHGGAELFNYPWDTFRTRHPDTEWWRTVSREFAQTAQQDSRLGDYFKDRANGTTNGHDWYPISGSRQDYMNYYHRTREATVEITNAKRFPARDLPNLWESLRGALLNYLDEARYGIHGIVTDQVTGLPLRAHITIPGHDEMQSSVYSERITGDFYRYLAPGTYRLVVSATGYRSRTVIVSLRDKQRRELQIALERAPLDPPARKK